MKKKFISGVFALALLVIAGYGVNRSMNSKANLSDLALQNVLALADVENPDPGEGGGGNETCLTDQKERTGVLSCHQSTVEAQIYDFSCVGNGSYCVGARGYTMTCRGVYMNYIDMVREPC